VDFRWMYLENSMIENTAIWYDWWNIVPWRPFLFTCEGLFCLLVKLHHFLIIFHTLGSFEKGYELVGAGHLWMADWTDGPCRAIFSSLVSMIFILVLVGFKLYRKESNEVLGRQWFMQCYMFLLCAISFFFVPVVVGLYWEERNEVLKGQLSVKV